MNVLIDFLTKANPQIIYRPIDLIVGIIVQPLLLMTTIVLLTYLILKVVKGE